MSQEEIFLYDTLDRMIEELDINRPLKDLIFEIQELYLRDSRPWIIGFSEARIYVRLVASCRSPQAAR